LNLLQLRLVVLSILAANALNDLGQCVGFDLFVWKVSLLQI